ncbi:MAG: disulfide bond formation protein B [Hyphomicrobiales bacterium]
MIAAKALPPSVTVPPRAAIASLVLAVLAIGGAWYSQLVWGLRPCELCLLQRWPYYVGVPLAALAIVAAAAPGRRCGIVALVLALLALVFLVSAGLGVYHAGVEWGFWAGPSACTGQYAAPASTDDFLKSLEAGPSVRCDEAAIRILGLSLAGWNAFVSLLIAAIAAAGAKAARRG